jgi:hypothetical protein
LQLLPPLPDLSRMHLEFLGDLIHRLGVSDRFNRYFVPETKCLFSCSLDLRSRKLHGGSPWRLVDPFQERSKTLLRQFWVPARQQFRLAYPAGCSISGASE